MAQRRQKTAQRRKKKLQRRKKTTPWSNPIDANVRRKKSKE